MSGVINGRYVGTETEDIVDAMFELEQQLLGGRLNDDDRSAIRDYYRPHARVTNALQNDMREMLDSTRIRFAEGQALDFVTEQIGIIRKPAKPATGKQQFYVGSALSEDVDIAKGTVVQTDGSDSSQYKTDEFVTLPAGDTSVQVGVTAIDPGSEHNVGADTVIEFTNGAPHPALETTNPNSISGGRDRENDDELRQRAIEGGNENAQATDDALIGALQRHEKVLATHLFVNDTDTDNAYGNGLPAWSMEIVVHHDTVAQDIIDIIGGFRDAGGNLVAGINGTEVTGQYILENEQKITYEYTEPTEQTIYVDVTLSKDPDTYEGNDAVRNAMVEYIGGILTDGSYHSDGLAMGDDVVVGEVEYAIRSVEGVYNVTDLKIGTSSSPTSKTSDQTIAIADSDVATLDGRDTQSFVTITTSDI